jgi:hypothetical protein
MVSHVLPNPVVTLTVHVTTMAERYDELLEPASALQAE